MGTPTTARSQAHSAVPLPSGEAYTRVRFCFFIRCDNSMFIRLAHFYSKVARCKASPLGRGTAERACTRAVVGVTFPPLFHIKGLLTCKRPNFCFLF